jgi:hypothetical protein
MNSTDKTLAETAIGKHAFLGVGNVGWERLPSNTCRHREWYGDTVFTFKKVKNSQFVKLTGIVKS